MNYKSRSSEISLNKQFHFQKQEVELKTLRNIAFYHQLKKFCDVIKNIRAIVKRKRPSCEEKQKDMDMS